MGGRACRRVASTGVWGKAVSTPSEVGGRVVSPWVWVSLLPEMDDRVVSSGSWGTVAPTPSEVQVCGRVVAIEASSKVPSFPET